ncbi:MAG: D-alanyl-D-alanine carboxypeptidase [Gemmiger sp.]|nr:D-alanyl-D-alanine carboxypeptidase [Gemmiger sp.]
MNKKILALILCLALLGAPVLATTAYGEEIQPATTAAFDLPCKAAILMDQGSGTVLYEKNADEQRPIASITKIMTLLLAFEALEAGKVKLTDVVPVSEHAYGMGGSQIWLEPGEQLTLNDMFKAICICSANDAAVAVAEFIGGSEPVFVQQMNDRAAALGMANTHFENACGLDSGNHLSSARDVAIMSREMLSNHPEVENYCTVWMDALRGGETQLINTNKLLKSYNGITGLKTGTTGGAGVCISASATREGLKLIAVVLGSESGKERFEAATTLLDYGFANYENANVTLPETRPEMLPVTHGMEATVPLAYASPATYLMPKGQSGALQAELELPTTLQAPLEEGTQVGTVHILNHGTNIADYPITVEAGVTAREFLVCFRRLAFALLMHPADFVQND